MAYKDKIKQKQYQHAWYIKKRYGKDIMPFEINKRIKMSEEYKKAHRADASTKFALKKKEILDKAFGNNCYLCHNDKILIVHRKDGKKHKLFSSMSLKQVLTEINYHKEEYVRVCWKCHRPIHWSMENLGLKWEDIVQLNGSLA